MITGRTKVAGVIGSPVGHSLSPALHNAGFASVGLDWVYVAYEVEPGSAPAALESMRTLGLGGLSVTMPHKEAVAEALGRAESTDELDPAALALRSVNTVVPIGDGRLGGYSTDGAGFLASLDAGGVAVIDRAVVVLGAGGAARAIIDALGRAGAAAVIVVNRSPDAALDAAGLAGPVGRTGSAADVGTADVVINATSVGMGTRDLPLDPARLRPGQVVADIVYHPRRTAFLDAAEAHGATVVEGLGMLVHQAVLQQQLWTGRTPDASVMLAAAERELDARRK